MRNEYKRMGTHERLDKSLLVAFSLGKFMSDATCTHDLQDRWVHQVNENGGVMFSFGRRFAGPLIYTNTDGFIKSCQEIRDKVDQAILQVMPAGWDLVKMAKFDIDCVEDGTYVWIDDEDF